MLTVTAIIVFLLIIFLWGLIYLLPRNDTNNAEFHHGLLDTDYNVLKGNSLANAKVRDSVCLTL